MELIKDNKELLEETDKVLDEAYSELKNFENIAVERFRELADIKNRVDKICSRIQDISLQISKLNSRYQKKINELKGLDALGFKYREGKQTERKEILELIEKKKQEVSEKIMKCKITEAQGFIEFCDFIKENIENRSVK